MNRKFYEGLSFKIISCIALVLFVGITITFTILLWLQKRDLMKEYAGFSERMGSMIKATIEYGMLTNNHEEIGYTLKNISSQKSIIGVKILDRNGKITHSTNKNELGHEVPRTDPLCMSCHREINKSSLEPKSIVLKSQEGELLRTLTPIEVKPQCLSHHPEGKVLGFISIDFSLKDLKRNMLKNLARMSFSAFMSFVGLAIVLSSVFAILVIYPLKDLLEAMMDAMKGNWDVQVKIKSKDEIGDLQRVFNHMISKLKDFHLKEIENERKLIKAQEELRYKAELESVNELLARRVSELELANERIKRMLEEIRDKSVKLERLVDRLRLLHHISQSMSSMINVDEIIKTIVDKSVHIMRARIGSLMLIDEDIGELYIKYAIGLPEDVIARTRVRVGDQVSGWVAKTGKPLLVTDIENDPRFKKKNNPFYETKSLISAPIIVKGKVIGVLNVNNKIDGTSFVQEELELLITLAGQTAIALENAKLYQNLQKTYFETIRALVNAIEAKDKFTAGHSERTTEYAIKIAKKMGLSEKRIEVLQHAAILHDIGKIGTDLAILRKEGKLTDEEWEAVKEHPLLGGKILEPVEFLKEVRTIIHQHHERPDGKGYPNGLKHGELSLLARIISVADAFEAMTSDRPYRRALTIEESVEELKRNSGTQFDPEVVIALIKVLEEETGKRFI